MGWAWGASHSQRIGATLVPQTEHDDLVPWKPLRVWTSNTVQFLGFARVAWRCRDFLQCATVKKARYGNFVDCVDFLYIL